MGVIEIISLIVAVVGGMAVWALTGGQVQFWRGKRAGKKEANDDAMRDAFEREEAGRDALDAGRASGRKPSERVLDND